MGTRVYIGGLPYRVKERDIERFFRGYGKLREVLIKNGYGFVVSGFPIIKALLCNCFWEMRFNVGFCFCLTGIWRL